MSFPKRREHQVTSRREVRPRRGRITGIAVRLAVMLVLLPFLVTLAYIFVAPPVSSLMVWRSFQGRSIDYRWQPIENISPKLVRAVITREDDLFCQHHGVNWGELKTIVEEAVAEESAPSRGGSTITMQIAKNLFLWPLNAYVRKVFEIPLAYWMDLVWTKRRSVEIYLNIAEWAPGIYGAEAAARHHFNTTSAKITRRQAGLLAVSLPNPWVRHAGKPGPRVRKMAARLDRRLKRQPADLTCLADRQ